MSRREQIFEQVMSGRSDSNIRFSELCSLLDTLGLESRIKGSHHIYWKEGLPEILNIQPLGSNAKAYQVKQVRNFILKYRLGLQ